MKLVINSMSFFIGMLFFSLAHSGTLPPPTAICHTPASHQMLPAYHCCGLATNKKWAWKNKWVAGSCLNASPYASSNWGCSMSSPVYGTTQPIKGICQYSYSTVIYR